MRIVNKLASDLVLINGKIITVDPYDRVVEAVAVKNGVIIAVGTNKELQPLIGETTEIINLKGKTVIPGFIDSHSHPGVAATTYLQINCISPPTKSIKEIIVKIEDRVKKAKPGEWIRGINYNQLKLSEKRHIMKEELDMVAPNNPVIITRLTGHMYILNSMGLKLSGITKNTLDPLGGKLDRNSDGEPNGLLHGLAGSIPLALIPPYTVDEIKCGLRKVYNQYSKWGVTTVHDPGTTAVDMRAFKELLDEGVKQVRIQMMMRTHRESPRTTLEEMIALGIESGYGNDWLKIMSLKIMGDGTGSGGTAGVYEPQKRGDTLGLFMTSPDEIKALTVRAQQHGIRVCIHSIGDRAIDIALDAIEEAQKKHPRSNMRHRIEHNSICTPKQLKRIKSLEASPASSIGYMWSIGDDYYENFGEERVRWCHPHKTMIEMGIIAGGNCDYPITNGNPMIQIYSAVTRKTSNGKIVGPEEAINVKEALKVYTWNGAYLEKEEHLKGSIEEGKHADMVVIDNDILSVSPEELKKIKVLKTIVNGVVVYNKD